MGEIYILPKKGERELPDWAKRWNEQVRQEEEAKHSEDDKRSQDNWGYKP